MNGLLHGTRPQLLDLSFKIRVKSVFRRCSAAVYPRRDQESKASARDVFIPPTSLSYAQWAIVSATVSKGSHAARFRTWLANLLFPALTPAHGKPQLPDGLSNYEINAPSKTDFQF